MNIGKTDTQAHEIIIDDGDVRLEDLMAVAFEGRRVRLSDDAAWRDKLQRSRSALEQSLSAGDRIYGVSTGVGYGSSRTIDPEHTREFAYQIIRQRFQLF